jgi:hypothetical protein
MSVDFSSVPTLKLSSPKPLFSLPDAYLRLTTPEYLDMLPDNSQFLIPMPLSTPAGSPYHVLVNWE